LRNQPQRAGHHVKKCSDETSVALTHGLPPSLRYEPEQVSKIEILRKLKKRFGAKIIRDVRFRVG
jgi:hypothetical protein